MPIPAGYIDGDDFTGTNGAAWDNTLWTTAVSGVGVADIQTNRGRMNLSAAGSFTDWARALYKDTLSSDFDCTARVTLDAATGGRYPVVAFRADGTFQAGGSSYVPQNGWAVFLNADTSNTWDILHYEASVGTDVGGGAITLTNGQTYSIRVRCVGPTIQVKVWASASAEPEAWNSTHQDAWHTSRKRFSLGNGGGSVATSYRSDWDDVGINPIFATVLRGQSPSIRSVRGMQSRHPSFAQMGDQNISAAVFTNVDVIAATGTGTAYDLTTAVAGSVNLASGTGTANNLAASVKPNAGLASGTGSAFDLTATVSHAVNLASGTGSAFTLAASEGINVGLASGTGTAYDLTHTIAPSPGLASGTGQAFSLTVTETTSPGLATGTGQAFDLGPAVKASVNLASGTGAAYDLTISTESRTDVAVGLASGSGAAYDLIVTVLQPEPPATPIPPGGTRHDIYSPEVIRDTATLYRLHLDDILADDEEVLILL